MSDFLTAIGLVLVLEGLIYGGFPDSARRMAEEVRNLPDVHLRVAGLAAMFIGICIVWLVRG